jgi:cobalt-precorrin 5A hydrolase
MIVAGLGSRRAISAEQVDAAIDAALLHSHLPAHRLDLIAVPASKGTEAGIQAAAAARGIVLRLITQDLLEAANPRTVTRSTHSMAAMNVHSVAEAAALAGAGPNARLLAPRLSVGPVTCALAEGELTA